jgi:hypothetical protein
MAVVTKYICDGCGAEKGLVNHWWMTWENGVIWEVMTFDETRIFHLAYCGESCVSKAFSEWMRARSEQGKDTDTGKG